MLLNYEKGSDLTLLNTLYIRPHRDENNKMTKPVIILIYKDNVTGVKLKKEIYDPEYEYYMIKDEYVEDYNKLIIEHDKVDKIKVPYRNLTKDIAERTGNLDFYYDNIKCGNAGENRRLHTHPAVLGSDSNIEDHYRIKFSETYKNEIIPISKCYLDIELDNSGENFNGIIEYGKYPINAVTLCMEHINKSFTFLLRYEDNESAEKFERELSPDTFLELKSFIREQVGGEKGEKKFGLSDMEYQIMFYDDEITLIVDLFKCINTYIPDFVMAWNMAFDIPYIIARLLVLGVYPPDVMCHPDFENKVVKYFVDERNENLYAERGDFATISSYSVYLDQMIHFASRRKGGKAINSFSLDNIGEITVGIKKLDYKHITQDLSELPYKDFKTFVFYNIMDTIVQKCIEVKTGDIDYIFGKCIINNTRYHKGHRQTVYLTNRAREEFKNFGKGYILGNNINSLNPDKDVVIPGAFVGDPSLVSDYGKIKLNNRAVDLFNNCDDFDYKSLYPSIDREFNMAPNTIIGLIKPTEMNQTDSVFKVRANESFGGNFLEDLHSGNILEFCTRWFYLADYSELLKDIEYYFTYIKNPAMGLRLYNYDGSMKGIIRLNKELPEPGIVYTRKIENGLDYYIPREGFK